jgi:phosphoserine phosphatase
MATMDDVTVTPVEGLNEENRPFPHVPFLGGITDPQAFWMLGGVSGVVVLVLAFTATDFAAIHIPLLVTILCYAACLVTGVAGVLLNQDGIEHRRKAHVRYWLRPRTRVGRLAGERFYVVERWTRRVRVPALPAVPALSVGGRRVWAARAATPARTVVLTGPTVRVRRPDARALVADATIETDEAVEDGRICAVRTNTTGNEKLARWRLTADITPIILRAHAQGVGGHLPDVRQPG